MNHCDGPWKLALLDLDGTLYRGTTAIPGAVEFVERLRKRRIQPVFFTNNSTRTPEAVCAKLGGLGIHANPLEVCSSAQASAAYIRERVGSGCKVGVIGQAGLVQALRDANLQPIPVQSGEFADTQIAALVLGMDDSVTYPQLAAFCREVGRLGWFVLTNPDVRIPSDDGYLPGNGALGQFVETATGVVPYVAGKPNPDFVRYALQRFQVSPEEVMVVGDNPATDVAVGAKSGVYTIRVKSGGAYPGGESSENHLHPAETHLSVADLFV